MNSHARTMGSLLTIGLLALAVHSCGGGGGGSNDTGGSPVEPNGETQKTELTDTFQLTADSYIASASNDAGQVLVLVAHGDSTSVSGTTEIRALQYTPSGGWGKPITVASGKTVGMAHAADLSALVLSDSGDAIFTWQYDGDAVLGYDLWTVARVGGVWQAPTSLSGKTGLARYSLVRDPSDQSVAGALWEDAATDKALYFSRYRITSGWDVAETVSMLLGSETSISLFDSKLGMDNAGNQHVVVTGNSGLRVRKRTITGWGDTQQIYTFDHGNGEYSPFIIYFATAPSGKAMLAYPALNGVAKYYSTFSFDGALWSGKIDTPSGEYPFNDREQILAVDNTGGAALSGTSLSGTCFMPSTGWSSVAVLDVANTEAAWSPCLESGGVATWNIKAGASNKFVANGYAAKIGTAGWSRAHVLTSSESAKGKHIVAIHLGGVVLYKGDEQAPEPLWAGRWTPPSNW